MALDLDIITEHLKAIHNARFFGHTASIALHRDRIDDCVDKAALPFELSATLKAFYRTETLSLWQFYADHTEMLIEQYGAIIIYWSSHPLIQHYSDMYMIHEMGLVGDSGGSSSSSSESESEEEESPSIPTITVTQYF